MHSGLLSITFYLLLFKKSNYLLILILIELFMINFSGSYIIKFILMEFILI